MKYLTFDKILFISAISLAVCGAFYSIVGIATLFSGAMISVGVMAVAIELGKICSVTYLYRYWPKTKKWLAAYLSVATLVLMLITSMGIFGYLSAAYQKSSIEFKAAQEKITMVEGQKSYLTDKIVQSKSRITTLNDMRKMQESRMNESLTNAFISRNPVQLKQIQDQTADMIKSADTNIKIEQTTIQMTLDEIGKIDKQVNEMKFASAGNKDIRTFQFVAEQFGTSLDKVAKWFIFTIIFVFDPLAVALILAYNAVTYHKTDELINSINPEKVEIVNSPVEHSSIVESINSEREQKAEMIDSSNPPVTSGIAPMSITESPLNPRPKWLQ